jgi:hypothetical protein
MNTHQCVLPMIIIITVLNVYVLGTRAMNLNMGHMVVPITYQTT